MPAAVLKPMTLADHGIFVPARPGTYRPPCPRCDRARDDAFAVTVEDDGGAVWFCHRCGWAGCCEGELAAWRSDLRSMRDHQRVERAVARLPGTVEQMHPTLSDEGRELWASGNEITCGTAAWRYLCEVRAISPKVVADLEHAIRWLPDHKHPCGWSSPALIALVTDFETNEQISLHRTWLARDGSGKAPIRAPRMLLKGHRKLNGVVRLTADGEVAATLAVAEGIETGLSGCSLGMPTWAALDAGNLAKLPVLDGIEGLTIIADHDAAGLAAATALAERWTAAGIPPCIYVPAIPGDDLNDELRAQEARP